ncbi:hypothetical protein [Streptomyces mirabilis]|uniref:hypothetical protein n=1 Tax=Streptomyces mirabilis TaxID=68239 RepID=UPI0033E4137A
MVTATFAMRNAYASAEELTAAREAARVAHDDFVAVAGGYLRQQEGPAEGLACWAVS